MYRQQQIINRKTEKESANAAKQLFRLLYYSFIYIFLL